MYVLTKISDIIPLQPTSFSRPTHDALEDAINSKYANKVLHNTGLCVCVHDIEKIEDGMIRPGDGAAYVKCVFRLVVFRPFIGEVLVGWISSCTDQGINVKMEFFNDIHIPKSMLFEDCHFIPSEQAWIWKLGDDKLYLDVNEKIRFRVEQEIFTEQHPAKPGATEDQPKQAPPYAIVGSCQTDGMGLVTWW
ncbi:DNA-directed RNA polymerase III subunit RPC8 [Trichomonascus vanleenenianus]|uniref:DNA-directed RNA polymerase III subunit RPC25 n=1 Tax=Trichomonascus vanleenenianus TaxID=2268995 RepID=UPI003ECA25D8